jgi:hypothetical protein
MANNYWGNMSRAVLGQGLAMGWGDELEARIRTLSGDETYEEELNSINESYANFSEENKGAALAGEIAGGFVPLIGSYLATGLTGGAAAPAAIANSARMASVLNKIRQGAQTATQTAKSSKILNNPLTNNPLTRKGARIATGTGKALVNNPLGRGFTAGSATGFVDGAGAADQGERLKGGVMGTAFGGTLGLALPITARTGKASWNWLSERLLADDSDIKEAALARVFQAVSSRGGSIQDVIDQVNLDRSMGINQSTIANATPALTKQAKFVLNAQRGDAPEIIEEEIGGMLAGSRTKAAQAVRDKLKNVNYYDHQDQLLTQLRQNAAPAYKKAYAFGLVDDPRIMTLLAEDDNFKAAYKRAQAIAKTEQSAAKLRGDLPSDFSMIDLDVEGAIPDVRTLDYIKRGMDDLLRKGKKDGDGGLGPTETSVIRGLKNDFLDVLDEATTVDGVSAYKEARKLYKGDIEVLDSLEMGLKDFQGMAPEEVKKMLNDLSAAEAETFVIGATRSILNRITKPRGNSNYALNVINAPDDKEKLEMLFPGINKKGFKLLEAVLLREGQLYKQANKILGGSPTQSNQAGVREIEDSEGMGNAMATGLETLFNPHSGLLRFATNALRSAKLPEATQEKMATMLMSKDPKEVAAVVEALEKFQIKNTPKVINLNTNEVLAVSGGANVFSEDPKETPSTSRAAAR